MNSFSEVYFLIVIFLLVFGAVIFGSALLIRYGAHARKRGLVARGRMMAATGAILLFFALVAPSLYISLYIYLAGPWHSRILTQGTSPSGREYCVLQAWNHNFFEPYTVSLWIRDNDGVWRWNYLHHQDFFWSSAKVTFSEDTANVSRDGEFFRDVSLQTAPLDLPAYQSTNHYAAAELSTEELFKKFAARH